MAAPTGPDDWVTGQSPAAASKPSGGTPSDSGPDDWSGGSSSAALGGDDLSQGNAIKYGLVGGLPFGKTMGAAVETAESYLPKWMRAPGDAPVDQTGEGWAQRYAENRARIFGNAANLQEAHPYTTAAAGVVPMLAMPGGATVKGAALAGGALGLSEGVESGDSAVGTVGRTILGAGLGAGGAKAVSAIAPVAGDATRKAVLSAADRLGVTMPRYAVSTSPLVQRAGMVGHSIPGMSTPLEEATSESVHGMGSAADTAAAGSTPLSAGEKVGDALKDWVGPGSKARVSAAYDNVNQFVNQNISSNSLNGVQQSMRDIIAKRGTYGDEPSGEAFDLINNAINKPIGLTYDGIKNLRSRIGEMMDQSILPAGSSQAELKTLYSGLSSDLADAVRYSARDPAGASAAFNRANALNAQTQAQRESLLKILGGQQANAPPEGIYGALQRAAQAKGGNINLLKLARDKVAPNDWNELSQGMVSQFGRDADGNFSPQRFLTDYGKISDEAKDELFAQGGPLRQNLDDLATVSRQWKSLYKYANPSGTAGHGVGVGMAIEGWRHPLKTLTAFMGGRALGKFLATPAGSGAAGAFVSAVGTGNANLIRNAATRVTATMGAQLGAKVDPMALAAAAMTREEEEHGGGNSSVDPGGGGQP
jgi:hypothetical protein